jgi:hypothetical protein
LCCAARGVAARGTLRLPKWQEYGPIQVRKWPLFAYLPARNLPVSSENRTEV